MPKKHHNGAGPTHGPSITLRPLTEQEIEQLERSLGRPLARGYLVYWMSQAIRDVVRLAELQTARECRDALLALVRAGRQWVKDINHCPGASLISQKSELDGLTTAVAGFCDRADTLAKEFRAAIKPGRHRAPFALLTFLDRMIGIAKSAKVLPSTPGRALKSQTAPRQPPAFFNFVKAALAIARDVIQSSPLSHGKEEALSILRPQSDEALGKLLERLRGRTGNYRESERGLVEWKGDHSE